MTIIGLESNNYFINNELDIIINSDVYVDIEIKNPENEIGILRYYPFNGKIEADLSLIIKSLFKKPILDIQNNIKVFEIKLTNKDGVEIILNKTFIRGGRFNRLDNNTMPTGIIEYQLHKYKSKIPYFGILPSAFTFSNNLFVFEFDYEKEIFTPRCKGVNVIFLNQFGTLSIWKFPFYTLEDTNTKSLGQIKRFNTNFKENNSFDDLGINLNQKIIVRDKVHEDWNLYIKHLIVSPLIFVSFEDNFNNLIKVSQLSNKWNFDSKEKTFDYKIDFDFEEVLKPSLLW